MVDANLSALVDDGRLLPAAQGCERANVGAAHIGAPDTAPAANQHNSDHDDCYCGQGGQGGSSPIRWDVKLEYVDASLLLEADLGFGHLVGPEVGRVRS